MALEVVPISSRIAKGTFRLRENKRSHFKVWEWTEDPRVLIRERINSSGGLGYKVVLPASITGDKEWLFQSRVFEEAQRVAREKAEEFRRSQSTARVLGDVEKIQAASALRYLRSQKRTESLEVVVREFVDAAKRLESHGFTVVEGARLLAKLSVKSREIGKPLESIVEFGAVRLKPPGGSKTVSNLATEMVAMKKVWCDRGDLREPSFKDFKNRANRVAADIGSLPLVELTKEIVMTWLRKTGPGGRTKKNYRMTLAEMLRYGKQRRYLSDNPLEEFTAEDVKNLEGSGIVAKEPSILTVEEAERLVVAAFEHPELDLGAAVALALFCGIRTEELKRLSWEAVRLDDPEPFVVIGPEIAKKRRIRNVTIPPNAVAWLSRWPRGPKVARSEFSSDFRKRFMKLQRFAGFRWKDPDGSWWQSWEHNCMRHSFGSYHYAKHGDSIETSRLLGHKADDDVLFAYYRALATKVQGEAYFAIVPRSKGPLPHREPVMVSKPVPETSGIRYFED